MAWAPLVALGLERAGRFRGAVLWPALALGVSLTTTGAEVTGQSILLGLVLVSSLRGLVRATLVAAVGAGLAAPVLLVLSQQLHGTVREVGFPTDVVLSHSVHPLSLLQVVIGSFHGNLYDIANEWWGQNFFPRGFPYILSLYIGVAALSCAGAALRGGPAWKRRLILASAFFLLVALGRYAGWGLLVPSLGPLHSFRFPVKAFFAVHFGVALLVAVGLDALALSPAGRAWRALVTTALTLSACLLALTLILGGPAKRWFASGFFPLAMPGPERAVKLAEVLADARIGASVGLAVAFIAVAVILQRLSPSWAVGLVVLAIFADLLRTGIGLNPTTSPAELSPSRGISAEIAGIRQRGRFFACDPEGSQPWLAALAARRGRHAEFASAAMADTIHLFTNVPLHARAALTPDLTMLVPVERTLPWQAARCRDVPALVGHLREAGVATVIAFQRLNAPGITWTHSVSPQRIEPLVVHFHTVDSPRPRFELLFPESQRAVPGASATPLLDEPGRIGILVSSPVSATLVVGEGPSPGWTATINGRPVPVEPRQGRLMEVQIPSGTCTVWLRYVPPGLYLGLGVLALAAVVCGVWEWRRPRMG